VAGTSQQIDAILLASVSKMNFISSEIYTGIPVGHENPSGKIAGCDFEPPQGGLVRDDSWMRRTI